MQLFYNVKLQCSTLKQFTPFSPAHSFISPFRQLLVQSPQNTAWILSYLLLLSTFISSYLSIPKFDLMAYHSTYTPEHTINSLSHFSFSYLSGRSNLAKWNCSFCVCSHAEVFGGAKSHNCIDWIHVKFKTRNFKHYLTNKLSSMNFSCN